MMTAVALKSKIPLLQVMPRSWKKKSFDEIKAYGANVQMNSIAVILYDPITKAHNG